jgi:phage terminase large subunit-like protein
MIQHVIRTCDPNIPYRDVTASRGKIARAESIAALYEQNRVRHAGAFNDLEDQLCAMTSEGFVGDGSPDRADALVWALTELMTKPVTHQAQFGRYSGTGRESGARTGLMAKSSKVRLLAASRFRDKEN